MMIFTQSTIFFILCSISAVLFADSSIDNHQMEVSILKEVLTDDPLDHKIHITATILSGIVLLTGEANTKHQKQRAKEIASSFQGVDHVVNQLDLVSENSLTSRANDSLIASRVKTELINQKAFDSTNIKIVTERGVVYLLGVVTPIEGEAAVELTKKVSGVVRIVKIFKAPTQ